MKRLLFCVAVVALSFTACKKENKQEQPAPQVQAPAADAAKAENSQAQDAANPTVADANPVDADAAAKAAAEALAKIAENDNADLQNLDPKVKGAFEAALNLMNQIGDAANAATCDDILTKLKEIPEDSFTQFNDGSKVIENIPEEERTKYTAAYGTQLMTAMMKMTTLNEKCKDNQEIEKFLSSKMGLESPEETAPQEDTAAAPVVEEGDDAAEVPTAEG